MECPYCHKEMEEGAIRAYQSRPVWVRGAGGDPLLSDFEMELAEPGLFTDKSVPSWYCRDCKVLITPVKEYETTWNKMKDKWKSFTEMTAKQLEEHAEERREAQREKAREKRRKKDPWED